ncbi:Probable carboxylesterase 15 [Linum grandiflorum]
MSETGVEECRGVLRVYQDGTVWRSSEPSFSVPVNDDGSVIWKDGIFDLENKLSLRLYKPSSPSSSKKLLPILYYIHLAKELQAVVIAPDYRLAPENRLPAAIEDGYMALKWLQDQALAEKPDTWLTDAADFNNVFISGDSAGGNIAHNLAVRLGASSLELAPVVVKGYVLLAPFFGGTVLTESEAHGPEDAFLNLELIDRFWRLSVPVGDTTDHPLINPFGPNSKDLEPVTLDPILVVAGGSDLLKDRGKDYAEKLNKMGKKVDYFEFEGQQHGFFTIDPDCEPANKLMALIKSFLADYST